MVVWSQILFILCTHGETLLGAVYMVVYALCQPVMSYSFYVNFSASKIIPFNVNFFNQLATTIPTILHLFDFWKKSSFISNKLFLSATNTFVSTLIHHLSKCTDEWCLAASTLFSISFFHKKSTIIKSQLCSKRSSKWPSPENFLATGGYFNSNNYMYCVMVLDWWLKIERKKQRRWSNQISDCFRLTIIEYSLLLLL